MDREPVALCSTVAGVATALVVYLLGPDANELAAALSALIIAAGAYFARRRVSPVE